MDALTMMFMQLQRVMVITLSVTGKERKGLHRKVVD